jgi:hypothetical protein
MPVLYVDMTVLYVDMTVLYVDMTVLYVPNCFAGARSHGVAARVLRGIPRPADRPCGPRRVPVTRT